MVEPQDACAYFSPYMRGLICDRFPARASFRPRPSRARRGPSTPSDLRVKGNLQGDASTMDNRLSFEEHILDGRDHVTPPVVGEGQAFCLAPSATSTAPPATKGRKPDSHRRGTKPRGANFRIRIGRPTERSRGTSTCRRELPPRSHPLLLPDGRLVSPVQNSAPEKNGI